MAYIASNQINVFPSTKRGEYQRNARLMTESSLVGLINELVDLKSFVITPIPTGGLSDDDSFEFNIAGYYFKINRVRDIPGINTLGNNQSIQASIILKTDNNFTELKGQDNDDKYEAIQFTNVNNTVPIRSVTINTISPNVTETTYTLRIIDKIAGNNTINSDAKIKIQKDSLQGIDGGELS